jgi:hypothetical protein
MHISDAETKIVQDIGYHAAEQAFEAVTRAIRTLPDDQLKGFAFAVAFGVIQHRIDGILELQALDPTPIGKGLNRVFENVRQCLNESESNRARLDELAKSRHEMLAKAGIVPLTDLQE